MQWPNNTEPALSLTSLQDSCSKQLALLMSCLLADNVLPEAVGIPNGQLMPITGASFEQRALQYMHYMAETAGQTQRLLQTMDERYKCLWDVAQQTLGFILHCLQVSLMAYCALQSGFMLMHCMQDTRYD